MALSAGAHIGPYEILAPIGAGGMGEVYRARDTKLGRDVAIKILSDAFAADPERRGRFEREARTLAALNHPHIAQIYGFEESGATLALAMELVDGDTLDARLKPRAPSGLPIDEALAMARQIADALEAAHEQGIVHRDLKPANIKIRGDGTVKVLDFGLAKALDPSAASSAAAMNSPTLTAHATVGGMILGTAAYMSPEQARGKPVDRRADIWAFGAVLYEMLAGKRAFAGEEISDTLASVLKDDPDWIALPADLPASLRRLLRRCLEKDPRKRLGWIGDARLELNERDEPAHGTTDVRPRNRAWQAALIVAAITGSSVATWVASSRLRSPAPAAVSRLSVLPPTGTTLNTGPGSVVISPDGRTLAFITSDVASGRNGGVWLRSLDSPAARLLPGTDGADNPFWSPDGRYLGFFSEDGKLRKISVDGGRAEEICDAKDARGGTWSAKGVIVFAPTSAGALMQVPATGGTPKPATVVDTARGEIGHQFPMFLPDGDHFLYAVRPQRAGAYDIVVGSLSGTQRTVVLGAQGTPVFAPPNQLVFLRKGTLLAQRFDPDSRTLAGEPTALADIASAIGGGGFGRVSASSGGTIAYIADQPVNMHLVWFDQAGRQTGNVSIPPGDYGQVRLARDERQAVLTRRPSSTFFDLWLVDLDRGGASPFVNAAGWNTSPVWSPDGDRIAFATNRDGPEDIFVKSVSAGTPEEPLFRSKSAAGFKRPQSWSDDGKYVVYMELSPETSADLFVIPLGDRTPRAYLRTPAYETAGAISPDERWMAYVSAETGRNEVYVQTFPTPSRKHRVSSTGASEGGVWWRHDGKQLLFANLDHTQLLVADVDARADFSSSTPRVVGHLPKGVTSLDVTPDLQRILALVNEGSNAVWSITVVQNWTTTAR